MSIHCVSTKLILQRNFPDLRYILDISSFWLCGLHCSPLEVSLNLLKHDALDSVRVLYQLSTLIWVALLKVHGSTVHHPHMSTMHMLVWNALPREVNKLMSLQHEHTSVGSEERKSFIHVCVHTFNTQYTVSQYGQYTYMYMCLASLDARLSLIVWGRDKKKESLAHIVTEHVRNLPINFYTCIMNKIRGLDAEECARIRVFWKVHNCRCEA